MKGVSVEIMGQNLTVASNDDDAWVKSVAGTVDERIRKLRANGNTVSSVNIAILAALNFADELEHLKREHQELIDRITAMKERLIDAIDGKLVLEPGDARSKGTGGGVVGILIRYDAMRASIQPVRLLLRADRQPNFGFPDGINPARRGAFCALRRCSSIILSVPAKVSP